MVRWNKDNNMRSCVPTWLLMDIFFAPKNPPVPVVVKWMKNIQPRPDIHTCPVVL